VASAWRGRERSEGRARADRQPQLLPRIGELRTALASGRRRRSGGRQARRIRQDLIDQNILEIMPRMTGWADRPFRKFLKSRRQGRRASNAGRFLADGKGFT
jgi:hypothetical protein